MGGMVERLPYHHHFFAHSSHHQGEDGEEKNWPEPKAAAKICYQNCNKMAKYWVNRVIFVAQQKSRYFFSGREARRENFAICPTISVFTSPQS